MMHEIYSLIRDIRHHFRHQLWWAVHDECEHRAFSFSFFLPFFILLNTEACTHHDVPTLTYAQVCSWLRQEPSKSLSFPPQRDYGNN